MEKYFNIRYEFDRPTVHDTIAARLQQPGSDYVCVADGVILNHVNRNEEYRQVVDGGMFCVCDSSYVPLYIRWLYGRERCQYCGADIFRDVVSSRHHRMIFLGAQRSVLDALQHNLLQLNPDVAQMQFVELPFCTVEQFDYPAIARQIEADGADIVWVALGAPKQEHFMYRLKPHLNHGVMLGVGAVFKFYSGLEAKRAPQWMVRHHLEFVHRISQEPRKQIRRCWDIVRTLPGLLWAEHRRKNGNI